MKSRAHRPRPRFVESNSATLDAIEWEELPSLVGRLHAATADATQAAGAAPAWEATAPAALDEALPSEPFRETLHGLDVRELREPDVFRHFFGEAAGESFAGNAAGSRRPA